MRELAAATFIASLGLATAAAAAPPAAAVGGATTADARCLLDMVALSNADDQNTQHLGQDGVVFFTGRISARDPNFDFTRLKSMAATMNDPKAIDAELKQTCVPAFQRYMQQMSSALSAPDAGAAPQKK